jgi:hypothetical protein
MPVLSGVGRAGRSGQLLLLLFFHHVLILSITVVNGKIRESVANSLFVRFIIRRLSLLLILFLLTLVLCTVAARPQWLSLHHVVRLVEHLLQLFERLHWLVLILLATRRSR